MIRQPFHHKIQISLLLLIPALYLASCEKIIDPDLKAAEPRIVIEGGITNRFENHLVKISRTIPFKEETTFNGIKGAQVTVRTSGGQVFSFSAAADGIYRSPRFRGLPGTTYNLEVNVEGNTYRSSSTMPRLVEADSIVFKQISIFGKSYIYPSVYYTDPPGEQNQYRYLVKVNDIFKTSQVIDDRFSNGNSTSDMITFDDGVLRGERVDLEMQCIDRDVFKYYYAISQMEGDGGPPVAPSNPVSNIDNGALGIFSAYTKSNFTVSLK